MTHGKPDLVLLDIGMPALDGKAVMRIVSKMGDNAPTIVFFTALDGRRRAPRASRSAPPTTSPSRSPRELVAARGAALAE